jgi:spore coat polysaccharide biosynthesis predicted glycosyltransferase SpsG
LVSGDGWGTEQIEATGFEAEYVAEDAHLTETAERVRAWGAAAVVLDSYRICVGALKGLPDPCPLIVTLSDSAGHIITADIVVNAAEGAQDEPYDRAACTRYMLGPKYTLLRLEFAQPPARYRMGDVGRILITIGGSDPRGLTPALLQMAVGTLPNAAVDVIVGPLYSGYEDILAAAAERTNVTVHGDPPDIRRLMLDADLAISGGGQTTYELAACATPCVAVAIAENQELSLAALQRAGVVIWAGSATDPDILAAVKSAVVDLAGNSDRCLTMGRQGRELVDGGGALRVAAAICDEIKERAL